MKFTLVINLEIETTKGDQEKFPNCGIQVTAKSLSTGDTIEGVLLEESEILPGQDLSTVGTGRSLEGKGKGKGKSKTTKTAVSNRTPKAKSKGKGKSTKKSSANRTLLTKDKGRGKTKILDKKKDVNKPGKKITKKVLAKEALSSKSKGKLSKMTKGISADKFVIDKNKDVNKTGKKSTAKKSGTKG